MSAETPRPHVVLLGGGHAHALVLENFAASPPPFDVTLVSESSHSYYSGMLPGAVAGLYAEDAIAFDVGAFAERCGARFRLGSARALDTRTRELVLDDGARVPYDWLSINVGSQTRGADLPGVSEYALTTRPISTLLTRLAQFEARAPWTAHDGPLNVVVVGGGAAGVELAFSLGARLRALVGHERQVRVTLVTSEPRLYASWGARLATTVANQLAAHGVSVVEGVHASAVRADHVLLSSGESLPCDLCMWAAGAAPPPFVAASTLALTDDGFIRVTNTLTSVDDARVLAAGDCASLDGLSVPKAGVYAVRQAPILAANLRAAVAGERALAFEPQKGFLSLLTMGDGAAIGAWRGAVFAGSWVMRWKHQLDAGFLEKFGTRPVLGEPRVPPSSGCAVQ